MPSCDFDTPAKRLRLKPRKNPYWFGVGGGAVACRSAFVEP
jgi:hypothetical protein